MAYYHEGRLSDTQAQVDYLKPDNNLKPNDPNTWIVDQVKYASYAEALMAVIDLLDILYGM